MDIDSKLLGCRMDRASSLMPFQSSFLRRLSMLLQIDSLFRDSMRKDRIRRQATFPFPNAKKPARSIFSAGRTSKLN